MQKELKLLLTDPPPGACHPLLSSDSDLCSLTSIDADIRGPDGTVYENAVFRVKIQIPERYPFQPPNVTFATPIYHPNIDNGGRICLDILNLPPKGAWQPSLNISTVITSIGLLLSEPNPDDGLMCEASKEYKYNRQAFDQKARFMTQKYAKAAASGSSSSVQLNSLSFCPSTKTDGPETLVESQDAHFSKTTQKKSWGLRKKLSLESSISGSKGSTDMEVNKILPDTEPGDLDHGGANNNLEKENNVSEKKMEKTDQVKQGNYGYQKESAAENTLILQMGTKKEPCVVQSTPSESSYTCQIKKEDLTDKENSGFADTKCEKLGSRSRKLSLGLKGPFQKFEVDNSKENRLPIQKLRLSRPRGTFGIGDQFSLSPLSDLQEVNECESRLIQSQKGSIDVLKLKREEKPLDEDDCYSVRDAREDVVIVLDSEGSDEEENRCSRRGKLLTRKRMRRSNLKLPTVT